MTDTHLALFGDDPEMTDAERDAIMVDFLAQHSDAATTTEALRRKPCICRNPLLFAAELGEGRCGLCGREPR